MRKSFILVACFIVLSSTGCRFEGQNLFVPPPESANSDWRMLTDEPTKALVEKSFELAGSNRAEIERFLNAVKPTEKKAATFLVAYMPPSGLASCSADDLLVEFNLAHQARRDFSWAKQLPESEFLNYVLPNFIAQEPYARFREYLYPRLKERVARCKDAREAALEVNRWCSEHFTYVSTQNRDQGVFESLRRGVGRCEEMCILYIAAARTVGIPARSAWTPSWATCDSNHAWVEVCVKGKWNFLGACEPADDLNMAWFKEPAKRAPIVFATAYGKVDTKDELVHRSWAKFTVVNTTRWYSETCNLTVKIKDEQGNSIAKPIVSLCVFNFGSFQPFSQIQGDENGVVKWQTGIGDYIVTSGNKGKFGAKKITTQPGKDMTVELILGKDDLEDGNFWLKYSR